MLFFSNNTAIQILSDGGNVRASDSTYGQGLVSFNRVSTSYS